MLICVPTNRRTVGWQRVQSRQCIVAYRTMSWNNICTYMSGTASVLHPSMGEPVRQSPIFSCPVWDEKEVIFTFLRRARIHGNRSSQSSYNGDLSQIYRKMRYNCNLNIYIYSIYRNDFSLTSLRCLLEMHTCQCRNCG